jgi:hypothetical protein
MLKALLFLAIPLTLVYLIGGSDDVIEALTKLFVLAGIQVVRHVLNESSVARPGLKKVERPRLKK